MRNQVKGQRAKFKGQNSGLMLVALLLAAGCATTGTVGSSSVVSNAPVVEPSRGEPETFALPTPLGPVSAPGEVSEPVPGGAIDWSGRAVRARGTGVVDPGNTNQAQARLMAERAAVVVAQRNLLEIIKGVRVDSDTKVKDFMTQYDVVYTHVGGIIKGARQLGNAKFDSVAGTVDVELEVELYGDSGVEQAVETAMGAGEVSSASLSPQVEEFFRQYGGLVMDGGNTGLKPSLFPKIFDESGKLLLDTRDYLRYAGRPGAQAVQFVSRLDEILARPEFARQPLVLKVKEVRGKLGTDIVIGRNDAEKLKWLKDGARFLLDAGRLLFKLAL